MKKFLSSVLAIALMATMALTSAASDVAECKGDVPKVEAGSVTIDGVKDAAYDNALCVDISQPLDGAATGTYGKAYMLWTDGSYYLLVEVYDADVVAPTEDNQLNSPWMTDSVEIFFDFTNEAAGLAEQYRIDCTGFPSYYIEGGAYYAYGPEDAKEYFDEYAASKTDVGYNVEMRVNLKEALEDYELKEGNSIGLQLQINDCTSDGNRCVYNMVSSQNAGSWDVSLYDYVTLGAPITVAAETEAETEAAAPETEAETEAVVAETVEETVVAPAETSEAAETAPQTFDAGVIAAAVAVISAAGYAVSRKHR